MAARLMARAEPGQIMISESVAEVVTGDYLLQNLGLLKVKGKAEPIPVSLVLGRRRQTARQPVNLFPNPLVGRDKELARLAQLPPRVKANCYESRVKPGSARAIWPPSSPSEP